MSWTSPTSGAGRDFTAYFRLRPARGGAPAASRRSHCRWAGSSCSRRSCVFITAHGAVSGHLDLQHLDRPAKPVPARRPGSRPVRTSMPTLEGHHPADQQPGRRSSAWRSTASRRDADLGPIAVGLGVLAAYSFSRMKFRGREFADALDPRRADAAGRRDDGAAVHLLNRIAFGDFFPRAGRSSVSRSRSTSTQLPFAIWNMKGYLDTIPKELEEAAAVDGARAVPDVPPDRAAARTPALAVTGFRLHRRLDRVPARPGLHRRRPEPVDAGRGAERARRRSTPAARRGPTSPRSRSCSPCR